jgi:hypothetical protein
MAFNNFDSKCFSFFIIELYSGLFFVLRALARASNGLNAITVREPENSAMDWNVIAATEKVM